MRHLGTLIGNELVSPDGFQFSPRVVEVREIVKVETVHVPSPLTTVDEIVETLARIVASTKTLPPEDQKRIRNFFATSSAVLLASGAYLSDGDQSLFQDKLRSAVRSR